MQTTIVNSGITHQPVVIEVDMPERLTNAAGYVDEINSVIITDPKAGGVPTLKKSQLTFGNGARVAPFGAREQDGKYVLKQIEKRIAVSCDERPLLLELAVNAITRKQAESDARDAFWAAERAPVIADRDAKRPAAIANCPADHTVATKVLWTNGDLCAAAYEVDGLEVLHHDQLDDHGCGVYYIPTAKVAAVQAKRDAEQAQPAVELSQPSAHTLALVKRYGSSDRAWEAEDESAWSELRQAGF